MKEIVTIVPKDYDMIYLGFCHVCGKNQAKPLPVVSSTIQSGREDDGYDIEIHLFRPVYGFFTHAYVITRQGATKLLQKLPVTSPLDVWLADNRWFNLKVYVASIIEKRHNRAATRATHVGGSSKPRPRRMSVIYQRSPLHDSDIIHSAHDT